MDRDDGYLNVRETAARLGVHENTVRNWARRGELPDARVPGSRYLRFRLRDIERLEQHRGEQAVSLQHDRRPFGPLLVTANEIKQWPETRSRDAQDKFPELIRRLLIETTGFSNVMVRAGDGVALTGWDGTADSDGSFLTAGELVFEFGVDKSASSKANSDYDNRIQDAHADITFIFATPRRWPGGEKWASSKRADGHFGDVRAIDADFIESWLSKAPATHYWLSEHLGLRPDGAETLESWWKNFHTATKPQLPLEVFYAGREEAAKFVRDRIAKPPISPKSLTIEADFRQDAFAFIFAAQADSNEEVPPILIVRSTDAWRRLATTTSKSVLLVDFDEPLVALAFEHGHHVLEILDRADRTSHKPDLRLPRWSRTGAAEAFRAMGVDFRHAEKLAAMGRRSLPALLRQLSLSPRRARALWAMAPIAHRLAPLLLVGSWTTRPADQAAVEQLTGLTIDQINRDLSSLARLKDPVVRRVGKSWSFTSPEDALTELPDFINGATLDRWLIGTLQILRDGPARQPDTLEEQVRIQLSQDAAPVSSQLIEALATTLATMGSWPQDLVTVDGDSIQDQVKVLVLSLLRDANNDSSGDTWRRISRHLPSLAEAAPEIFLEAVHDALEGDPPLLARLFDNEPDPMVGSAAHTGMLWSLEILSWAPEYFLESIRALAHLARIDPGGRLANRPKASLTSILTGWVHHTSASLQQRKEAISVIFQISERDGWSIVRGLWPRVHQHSMPPASPKFHKTWIPESRDVAFTEYSEFVSYLVEASIHRVGTDPERIGQLVSGAPAVSPADQSRIVSAIETQVAAITDPYLHAEIWRHVDKELRHHRKFADAQWAMPQELLRKFETIIEPLRPQVGARRFLYLFDPRPDLPDAPKSDWAEYDRMLQASRTHAIKEIAEQPDRVEQLRELAEQAESSEYLGRAIASTHALPNDLLIFWLDAADARLNRVGRSWAAHAMWEQGAAFLNSLLEAGSLRAGGRRAALESIPTQRGLWDALESQGSTEDIATYWMHARLGPVEPGDALYAIGQLLTHDRAFAAAEVASYALREDGSAEAPGLSPAVIANILNAALQQSSVDQMDGDMTAHHFGRLLDALEAAGGSADDLARFEFAFFELLRYTRLPRQLFRSLTEDATFFADLVRLAYRPKDDEEAAPRTERDGHIALQAWAVLDAWSESASEQSLKILDEQGIDNWVRSARFALSEVDRSDVGDETIGRFLALLPEDIDGTWPSVPVRDVMEQVGSTDLETGILIGKLNSRGVITRGVYQGGETERQQADEFRKAAHAASGTWPRTTRLLRRLADSYENDARHTDDRADAEADRY